MGKKKKVSILNRPSPELSLDGFDRKLYCWIRQHRQLCALHKCLYYEFGSNILTDQQYDFLENQLVVVEERHKQIAEMVTAEGYLSPDDYVGSVHSNAVLLRAKKLLDSGVDSLPFRSITQNDTDNTLYEAAIEQIENYPI